MSASGHSSPSAPGEGTVEVLVRVALRLRGSCLRDRLGLRLRLLRRGRCRCQTVRERRRPRQARLCDTSARLAPLRAIGSTGRGSGPAYEDKVARRGIRVADLLRPEALEEALGRIAEQKNFELEGYYHWQPVDAGQLYRQCLEWGRQLEPYVDHTERTLEGALRDGKPPATRSDTRYQCHSFTVWKALP